MNKLVRDQKEPGGWLGNIFYPDGFHGSGFGIEALSDGRVWFPAIKPIGEETKVSNYPGQDNLVEPSNIDPGTKQSPNIVFGQQLSLFHGKE